MHCKLTMIAHNLLSTKRDATRTADADADTKCRYRYKQTNNNKNTDITVVAATLDLSDCRIIHAT